MQVHSRALITFFTLAIASTTQLACSDDDEAVKQGESADTATSGKDGSAGKAGGSAAGKAGSSAGKSGSDSKAGTTAAASGGRGGGTPAATMPGGLSFTCSEEPSKNPVTCGGQTCKASTDFAMNPCIVPCCVNEGGKEMCGSKSTADMLSTECSAPVKPAPECPDVDSQNGPLKGCCNTKQHKCGIISTLRPGCITESTFIMFTNQPACGMEAAAEDAGVGPDAG